MVTIIYLTKELRLEKGLSVRQLANLTNCVSKSQISAVENNKRHPTLPILYEIANALEVPFDKTYEIVHYKGQQINGI